MVFHQPRAVETQGIGEAEFIQRFMINLSLAATHMGGYGEFVKEINIHRVGASKINAASTPRQVADRLQAAILTLVWLHPHRVGKEAAVVGEPTIGAYSVAEFPAAEPGKGVCGKSRSR